MRAWAPGRVNLIGEHTDYSGGLVLPAATQLGISVEVEATADQIVLSSVGYDAADPIAPDGGGPAAAGWGRFAQAVAAELAELGRPAVGLTGAITSEVPAGAGLSSSAALEVAIGLALCAVAGFELEPLELALACQRAELRAVGVPCGILDQAASVLGRPGSAILLDCASLEHRFVPVPEDAALLVVDSGVERRLESSGYGDRRAELERALTLVGAERSTTVGLEDLAALDPVSERRLRHVVTENERVRRFAAAFETGDLETAGRLLFESHASLRDDYEVSVPEIDLLVELARSAGALGARIVGGGFGGAVLVLAALEREAEVGESVVREYAARTGKETRPLAVRPSAGAGILPAR
ncbi:MAG TPA: galactokinase [Gaiellaceae bacterium]